MIAKEPVRSRSRSGSRSRSRGARLYFSTLKFQEIAVGCYLFKLDFKHTHNITTTNKHKTSHKTNNNNNDNHSSSSKEPSSRLTADSVRRRPGEVAGRRLQSGLTIVILLSCYCYPQSLVFLLLYLLLLILPLLLYVILSRGCYIIEWSVSTLLIKDYAWVKPSELQNLSTEIGLSWGARLCRGPGRTSHLP